MSGFKCAWCGLTTADLLREPLSAITATLHERVESAGSQHGAADVLGISPQYLNDILHGRREISETVADALGYRRIVVYLPNGTPDCDAVGLSVGQPGRSTRV